MTFPPVVKTASLVAFMFACSGVALQGVQTQEGSYVVLLGARVAAASDAVSRVWPGFWPPDQIFALSPLGDGALLVSSRAPDEAEARVLTEGVPPELENRAFYIPALGTVASGGFVLDHQIGGLVTPMIQVMGADIPDRDLHNLAYLYHETFHAFQGDAFSPLEGVDPLEELFVDPRYLADPEFLARLEAERDMLRAALSADEAGWGSIAERYLASRDVRLDHAGPPVAAAEDQLMRKEGTAHFVGWAAALLAEGRDVGSLGEVLGTHLGDPVLRRMPEPTDVFRRTAYYTGAATAYLLERTGVDWRTEVQQGGSMVELLRREVGVPAPGERLDPTLTEKFDFRRHLPFYRDLVAAWSVTDLPVDSSGSRIVVEGARVKESGTRGEARRPAAGVVIVPKNGGYSAEGPDYLLRVTGHVVVIDSRPGSPVHTIHVPDGVTEGLPYPHGVPVESDGFDLDVPGVRISIRGRVTVLKEGRVVHLRVGLP